MHVSVLCGKGLVAKIALAATRPHIRGKTMRKILEIMMYKPIAIQA